jgi:hypothetical protein
MKIEVSIGEVLDKISILAIKLNEIKDDIKLKNIQKEFQHLSSKVKSDMFMDDLYMDLCSVNRVLWDIEDKIRVCEKNKDFGDSFIELARMVYKTNDMRADVKKKINIKYNSDFIEEKSYQEY